MRRDARRTHNMVVKGNVTSSHKDEVSTIVDALTSQFAELTRR